MVDLTNIGTLFAFILVCVGIIIMRFRDPGRAAPLQGARRDRCSCRCSGSSSCLFLIAYLPPSSWWRFVGWLAAGLVIYGLYGYRNSAMRAGAKG